MYRLGVYQNLSVGIVDPQGALMKCLRRFDSVQL